MSTTEAQRANAADAATGATIDVKLEAIGIPVSDANRAKAFYQGLGWRLDADLAFDNGFRVIQCTPPGSPASIQFGTRVTCVEPGSAQGLYLVVSDVDAARAGLVGWGAAVEVSTPACRGTVQHR